ncbi:type II secretion system pilot lipoprotein GspS-beta [Vibrio sp. V27_P1S3P104]|uniref:GspS/AspS pilotin family protein n=1 Tax=Vibrio TaxID=662 RepID=UPI000C16AF78|nr:MULTISPECIES: GspS/AspS pilotin family protein [Vibrio]NAW67925.1 type II secretion system pilot lipoprotein GspS-beta [Vibrio sp. V28_P6S34P95]NAX04884.1 type II secretion system pilot lipoprotein GspS-beta [Vibrio sp. V30_P3S12P165]NAX32964.1 type II secretion system pilot lipoprotein GspS-beta [Vibrio sp. V29_P1S30P107]NAX36483.1 type II secretion system pilot lipoprotein GspS-beta [Vibrio sp. V27_P1S3P104]NAX40075.1 type II secretion system pilot lipoprotein GspS-beta [Vibrio sp. V26_P1
MKKSLLGITSLMFILLSGCSSTGDQQKHLELLAANRASVLNAELPIEQGPLNIMRASSKGTMIEMMMIYNIDQQGAQSLTQVIENSVQRFCSSTDIRANLDAGISYRLQVRNPRGQLMVDQIVTKTQCH